MPIAWWLALALLIVNDHVLKGSGLLPGWFTGKLSDFAGLVVAPLLGCAALGLRSDRARAWIFGAAALAFAAIKLHEPCAIAAAGVLTALGIPSRIWCDPTDLIALSVLPWAAQLARSLQYAQARDGLGMRQRLGLAIAACACLATSDESFTIDGTAPFIINWTRAPVQVETDKRYIDCATGEPSSGPINDSILLKPGRAAAIGWWNDGYAEDAGDRSCGEATVRVGGESVRIVWMPDRGERGPLYFKSGNYSEDDFPVEADDQWIFDLGVTVTGAIDAPALQVGSAVEP